MRPSAVPGIAALLVVLSIALIAAGPAAQQTPSATLGASDIVFEGYRDVRTNGGASTWGKALSHHYVDGEVRFLTIAHPRSLHEFSIASVGLGQTVAAPTRSWELPEFLVSDYTGIWFEQSRSRLWILSSVDYGEAGQYYPSHVTTLTLDPAGTRISNLHTVSLEGISSKMVFGGAQAIPEWAQKALGCGPYAVGWGGYTSLMHERSRSSLGPVFICLPDPAGYADGSTIPRRAFKVLLDAGESRGVRLSSPVNYLDGGDPRQNPSTRPSGPPASSGRWQSPNREGLGWFVWGDSYYNTGMWIEAGGKRAWVAIASLCTGAVWYGNSSVNCDGQTYEMHIWDPARLGRGQLTRPDVMLPLTLPRGNTRVWPDYGVGKITGATYDSRTQRVYLLGFPFSTDNSTGRLYSFRVAAGATAGAGR